MMSAAGDLSQIGIGGRHRKRQKMDFVDLDRYFVPIYKDQDADFDWGPYLGRRYGRWLSWSDLLAYRRVVLLAEALSGKTEELKHQADQLKRQGFPAFFVRIEDLGTREFRAAIDPDDIAQFETWKAASSGDAWFFLDSVDEARLNGTVFETALREFRRELDRTNLNRAYVIVSCRVSDWKGKADRNVLKNELPFEEIQDSDPSLLNRDEVLLGPIFKKNDRQTTTRQREPKRQPSELLVVQITPLSDEQRAKMAKSADIDAQKFVDEINRSGLHTMAERPGDLIDLIGYWKTHKQFGSLIDMTEEGVRRKLREEDPYRPAAGILSPDEARLGAERLAAALVLCKTFSLKAPGQEPDSALSRDAIDPSAVLGDWDSDKVNALVRTGLFAPGTFGRVKFHQRTTQEYLAACWLRSLSSANCPDFELRRLLFAEPYGEKTVVASLAPVAAWLAHWIPFVRETLIDREPTALIVHGDPKSLSIKAREDLLDSYAKLDAAGKLDSPHVDYRAAWMFSSQDLGDAINRCWNVNARSHFRLQLLRFIEEGRIKSCLKLARVATLNHAEDHYVRLLGVRALAACKDTIGLRELAKQVRDEPSRFNSRLAPEVAIHLYPTYIDTSELLQLIVHSQQPDSRSSKGFASHLADFYRQAPNRKARILLVSSVSSMVTTSQYSDDTANLAPRSAKLAEGIAELAKADLDELGAAEIESGTVSLLMAVERVARSVGDTDVLEDLRKLVRSNKALNRRLVWGDAAAFLSTSPASGPPRYLEQIGPYTGRVLWGIDQTDLDWLIRDAKEMPEEAERRMAFSGAVSVLLRSNSIDLRPASFDRLIVEEAALRADFAVLTAMPEPQQWELDHAVQEDQVRKQREDDQQSWRDFRDSLIADPTSLSTVSATSSWDGGLWRLSNITKWVKACGTRDGVPGMSSWRKIDTAFSPEVTKQYCLAMRKAWRAIPPERPKVTAGPTFHTKLISRLAIDALELDSFDANWLVDLSDADVKVAIRHATRAGTIKDRWVVELIRDKLNVVISDLLLAVRQEVTSEGRFFDVLSTVAYQETDILPQVSNEVFRLLSRKEPSDKSTLQHCIRILINGLEWLPHSKVRVLILRRLKIHTESSNNERRMEYLSLLAKFDGEAFANFLSAELHQDTSETTNEFAARVQKWIGSSFDSYSSVGMATAALRTMSIQSLAGLLRLAYRHIARRQNADKEEDSRVTSHELADQGRNALLEALFSRPGPEAYATFLKLADEPEFVESSLRFKELAHKKAQNDIDLVAWKPSEVVTFGRDHLAPVKTGAQLFDLVKGVFIDIDASLRTADASSRTILARAENEEDVQGWLAERLNERRHGRFFVHREPEVADRNAPDIVVCANAADVQVAIEVKNANMKWTVLTLERAIKNQLSRDYLRSENRRHGILVLSIHKLRTWQFGGATLNFEQLVEHLQIYASSIVSNDQGPVQLCVCVIDARDRSRLTNIKGKHGRSSPDR